MCRADRVATHFPEYFELTLGSAGIESRPQGTEVVVLVDAFNFYELTIDINASVRIETQ
jgi:hypothetical protein